MSSSLPSSPLVEAAPSEFAPRLLRIAWMGVLLGLAIELLLLLVLGLAGKMPPLLTIIADTLQKMTWSFRASPQPAVLFWCPRGVAIA